ncbi:hypothetical protein K466DRAFT_140176 [Polyporus arcularius HHB13444]|uniref:Uncharacterized protein n=1 Tax=Polyporus arcularius HHB13444 TaxID=1314778 RepID=A0A5C3PDT8_9APHY|nr:hypothetical protein K466DRAFT_140176 [Polyporus arcularius HHB13444]
MGPTLSCVRPPQPSDIVRLFLLSVLLSVYTRQHHSGGPAPTHFEGQPSRPSPLSWLEDLLSPYEPRPGSSATASERSRTLRLAVSSFP